MNRAETQHALRAFHDRLACAQIADPALGARYLGALRAYARELARTFDDIDAWSVQEYEAVCEYFNNNHEWIQNAGAAMETLQEAYRVFAMHRRFLLENGTMAESLVREPNPPSSGPPGSGESCSA